MNQLDLKEIERLDEFDRVVMIGEGDSFDKDTGEPLDADADDGEIQCCSCERFFDESDLTGERECPFCFSGNWVYGCIDEAEPDDSLFDSSDDGEALASAGYGTDEDYGWCGTDDF